MGKMIKLIAILILVATTSGCGKPMVESMMLHDHFANSRRQAYVKEHPDTDKWTKQAILEGRITIGMTCDEAQAAMNGSREVATHYGRYGGQTWIYKSYDWGCSCMRPFLYVYFNNACEVEEMTEAW
jgi:hypothetical protein